MENTEKKEGFFKKHEELFKFIKFSIVGTSSTIIELAVYYVLVYAVFKNFSTAPVKIWILEYDGLGFMWAFLISTAIGYAIAFILNRKVTFAANANPALSVIIYIIMVIFTIFATTWLGMEILRITTNAGGSIANIGEIAAKPIVALLATAWTYPINRFLIHRKKSDN